MVRIPDQQKSFMMQLSSEELRRLNACCLAVFQSRGCGGRLEQRSQEGQIPVVMGSNRESGGILRQVST